MCNVQSLCQSLKLAKLAKCLYGCVSCPGAVQRMLKWVAACGTVMLWSITVNDLGQTAGLQLLACFLSI